ncbi:MULTISPECIES: GntR family transcriptional regulator [unclassified Streptomyces]|uniref:GntR family transcriptional regulator n=1 Tax=unclassified Streptomyces TaxID=2593676 RepID=UPI002E2E1DED|nr:GntR family transcriptional regulator [Streptomyces sp. NBC_00223]
MTARHQLVAEDLRRRITTGEYEVGERLPPETRLASQYHVSTPTLRDALDLLRTEGLVAKFQGRGNFVCRPTARMTYPGGDETAALDVVVSATERTATGELAAHLGRLPDDPITEYVCLSHRDDGPQVLAHVHVPHAVSGGVVLPAGSSAWGDDILDGLAVMLAAGGSGVSSFDQVTARFATGAEAQSLRITARTPVLAIHRTVTADDGRTIACVHVVLPGDRAEVAFTVRTESADAMGAAR